MLVRNSSSLRQEIWMNLRSEYNDNTSDNLLRILNHAPNLCIQAFSNICLQDLGCHYGSFNDLANMQSNHPIFPEIPTGHLSLTGDLTSTSDVMFAASGDLDTQMYQYVNDTLQVNLGIPGFVPSYELQYPIGPSSNVIYGVNKPDYKLWLRLNIQPQDKEEYCDNEQMFFEPILDDLHKIHKEFHHYLVIFEYFKELFDELPSLNQMYKACPTILNYVSEATKDNLFKTIKGKNEERLDELKPPDAVALALARNKLRGKH